MHLSVVEKIDQPENYRPMIPGIKHWTRPVPVFEIIDRQSDSRQQAETYIDSKFRANYGATLSEYLPLLITMRCAGKLSGAANMFLIREWGRDIDNEFETALSLQARYRYSRALEPALELYAGQDMTGIGPVLLGNINVGIRKSFNWEAGVIFGADNKSPDQTFRLLFEYEF